MMLDVFSENWTKGLSQHIMESTYNGVNAMSRERWPVDSLREFSQAPVSIMIMIQPNISILIMIQPSIAMMEGATSTVVSITLQLLEGESPLRWCHEFNFSFQTSNIQINMTILSLNMYFSVHIVHFQVI